MIREVHFFIPSYLTEGFFFPFADLTVMDYISVSPYHSPENSHVKF